MELKFGIWDHFENRPGITPAEQYKEKIKLLQKAEELGFYCYHLAEHHLTSLDMGPSPNVFFGAVAQATSRIRFGAMVYIMPLYHPVRLVQELVMLDHMSEGRLVVGVGRGARKIEHDWFGIDALEARGMTEEFIKVIVSALTTGNIKFEGKYYNFPDGPLDVLPLQKPYPEFWYAGGAETAGKAGMNFFGHGLQSVKTYWDLWEETRNRPDRLNPQVDVPLVGITKRMVIRENYDEAVAIARRAWVPYEEHWAATSLETPEGHFVAEHNDFDERLAETDGRLLIGTPAMAREMLEPYFEAARDKPSLYLAPALQWGDITTDEAIETMALFSKEVMDVMQPTAVR